MSELKFDVAPYGKTSQKWKSLYSPKPGDITSLGMQIQQGEFEHHVIQLTTVDLNQLQQFKITMPIAAASEAVELVRDEHISTTQKEQKLITEAYNILNTYFNDTTSPFATFNDENTLLFRRTTESTCC